MTGTTGDSTRAPAGAVRRGMLAVAVGLAVYGGSNFAYLALVGRDLGPALTAPVAVTWTLLNAVGIGLFLPLEQETGRRLSAAAARLGAPADLRRMVAFGLGAVAVLLLVSAAAAEPLAEHVLGGRRELVVVLALGLAGQALAYFARGVLAGTNRFGPYGAQLAVDGALRLVGSVGLFAAGNGTPWLYGLVLVAAPVVATLVTVPPRHLLRHARPRAGGAAAASAGPLTMLVTASLAGQLLANAGPVAIAVITGPADQALSGRFVAAVTVARIPLFLFAAVQAVFLPTLAALVARRQVTELAATVRRAVVATAALAVAGVVGVAVAGPWALRLVYGPAFDLPVLDMTLIALSGGVYMLSQVLAQALLAHDADGVVAGGWLAGLAVLLGSLVVPLDPSTRVAIALCTGSLGALAVHAVGLRLVVVRWLARVPTPQEETR